MMDNEPSRLEKFLKDRLPGLQGGMWLNPIGGGQLNPTCFVNCTQPPDREEPT